MHGQFYRVLERPSVGKEKSLEWLCSTGLKGETDSLIIATQNQAPGSRYHHQNIMQKPTDSKCSMCCKAEHIKHIVAGCTTLALSKYTNRLNKVAGYIHRTICKLAGLQFTDKYHEHIPDSFMNINGSSIVWDVLVITNRIVLANRPHIVKGKAHPLQAMQAEGSRRVKAPRFLDIGTIWW
jgi:hypothetical protein